MESINLIDILVEDSLNRCIEERGLEGTLETIHRAYSAMPETKNLFLKKIKERLNG